MNGTIGERVIAIEKGLVLGNIQASDVVAQYDFDGDDNRKFFKELAAALSDPCMDFPEMLKAARKEWHIAALAEGLCRNRAVLGVCDRLRVQEIFDAGKQGHLDATLLKAIESGSQLVQHALVAPRATAVERRKIEDHYFNAEKVALLRDKPCKPKGMISQRLFSALIHSGLALRHVSSRTNAEKELANGTTGDALSISAGIAPLMCHLLAEGRLAGRTLRGFLFADRPQEDAALLKEPSTRDFCYRALFNEIDGILPMLTEGEAQTLRLAFEECLRQFLFKSIFFRDNPLPENFPGWKGEWEKKLSESSCFIICWKDPQQLPYDQSSYFNLGKCGKGKIAKEKMQCALYPPSLEQIAIFQTGIADCTEQILAISQATVDYFLQQLIEQLEKITS